uniref:Uncharacterized protein n=1 Tax=Oryza sativa subsp. japonica TaxID=39947 RepID=Q60D72_ORYSJ|nr:hypothetical protein [Oryza sativa Japonica Group]
MAPLAGTRRGSVSGGEPRRGRGGRAADGVAKAAAAGGCTARRRWGARERSAKWGKSERGGRRCLKRGRGSRTWPGAAGFDGRRGGERDAGGGDVAGFCGERGENGADVGGEVPRTSARAGWRRWAETAASWGGSGGHGGSRSWRKGMTGGVHGSHLSGREGGRAGWGT